MKLYTFVQLAETALFAAGTLLRRSILGYIVGAVYVTLAVIAIHFLT